MRSTGNTVDAILPSSSSSVSTLTLSSGHVNSETKDRLKLCNFFLIYFNFMYYLGGSPFRLVRDPATGYYLIHTWRPQQIICAFLNSLSFFRFTAAIRSAYPDDPKSILFHNPSTYLLIIRNVVSLIHKFVMLKMFWFDKTKYQNVVNAIIQEESNLPNRKSAITHPYFSYFLFGVNLLKISACLIGGCYFIQPISSWSPVWWLRRLVGQSHFAIGFELQPPSTRAPNLDQITFLDGVLALLMALSDYQRQLTGLFADLLVFISALTLWVTASSFSDIIEESVHESDSEDEYDKSHSQPERVKRKRMQESQQMHNQASDGEEWNRLYTIFQSIQRLSSTINSALGDQVTLFMTNVVIYFSVKLNEILLSMDWYRRSMLLVYYTQTFALLYISAEICEKVSKVEMKTLKLWLLQKDMMKNVPLDEANLVLYEVGIAREIGVQGSNAVTLTYSFIASFISAVLTFFVICYQDGG